MGSESTRPAPTGSASQRLPWALGLGGLLLYLLSLNPWVSLQSLGAVARAAGWLWYPQRHQPLTWLVLQAFGVLPESWIPRALNLFSAACAALVLLLLGRAIALWPPPRRRRAATRSNQPPAPPSTWQSLLPPLLAAIVCGLQLTFWEAATDFTGEMVDLVLLAYVMRGLLEFRNDRKLSWLWRCAGVYGAAMANNGVLVGALPLFLGAVAVLQGRAFFQRSFLLRLGLWGAAGMSFYLLLPAVRAVTTHSLTEGWQVLKADLQFQKETLLGLAHGPWRFVGLTAVLPLMLLLIPKRRTGAELADKNPLTRALSRWVFHLMYATFLLFALWMALDPVFGQQHLGAGPTRLLYCYLGALVAGGSARHFLRASRRQASIPFRTASLAALGALAIALPLVLLWRNLGRVRETNGPALRAFARELGAGLPSGRSAVLSDDPRLLYLLRAELSVPPRDQAALLLDTTALPSPKYQEFLARRYGVVWPEASSTNRLTEFVSRLSAVGPLCYLHPSFGYYFERLEASPRGLVYQLVPRVPREELHGLIHDERVDLTETFWQERWNASLLPLVEQLKREPPGQAELTGRWVRRLHLAAGPTPTTRFLGMVYSRALNDWGVRLQRQDRWPEAAVWFERALKLNPGNLVAGINLAFNQAYRNGSPGPLPAEQLKASLSDLVAKYRTWDDALNENGPVDEPTCLCQTGERFLGGGNLVQGTDRFARAAALAPGWPKARLGQARCQLARKHFEEVLQRTEGPALPNETANAPDLCWWLLCRETALRGLGRTNEATACLENFVARSAEQAPVLARAAELYVEAAEFGPALRLFEHLLTREPGNTMWLSKKGFAELQLGQTDAAIATLTRALELAPTHQLARLNRAIARLRANRLDAAQADYQELAQATPNAPKVLFGLGEIAWRKHETNAFVQFYTRYLSNSVPASADARLAAERLAQAKPR